MLLKLTHIVSNFIPITMSTAHRLNQINISITINTVFMTVQLANYCENTAFFLTLYCNERSAYLLKGAEILSIKRCAHIYISQIKGINVCNSIEFNYLLFLLNLIRKIAIKSLTDISCHSHFRHRLNSVASVCLQVIRKIPNFSTNCFSIQN